MPIITWSDAYSINVKAMDAQHKRIIELTNQLYDAMKEGKGNQEVAQIVQAMIDYANEHFRDEERILAAYNYPQLAAQKAEHQAFIQKATEFKKAAQEKKLSLSISVSSFLKEWWTQHIQKEDKEYAAFLNKVGVN